MHAAKLTFQALRIHLNDEFGEMRRGMAAACAHPFFEGLGGDGRGDGLYTQTPPPLAGGAAAPQPNASWTRRQNSIMWSPLPQRYAFSEDEAESLDPIAEGADEAAAHFTRRLTAMSFTPPLANDEAQGAVAGG